MEHPHKLFDEKSDLYARARPHYPANLYQYLASLCQGQQVAWDCACGNGQVAVDLVNDFDRVYATDVSPQQIANAIQKPQIWYEVMPAEATTFDDNLFDLICVAQALHWFDYDKFWPEVERVLKKGGIFAAWGYNFFTIEAQIDAAIETALLDPIKPYWSDRNQLLWNHYRDVPFPFEKVTTPIFPMVMTWTLDELFAYLHTWSSIRTGMKDIGDAFFEAAYQNIHTLWGDPAAKRAINMDFCLIVGQA